MDNVKIDDYYFSFFFYIKSITLEPIENSEEEKIGII